MPVNKNKAMEYFTKYGYFSRFVRGRMSYPTFLREVKIYLSDKEISEQFGKYKAAYKLSEKQIKLLNALFDIE